MDHLWFDVTTKQSTEKNPAGAGNSLTVKVMVLGGKKRVRGVLGGGTHRFILLNPHSSTTAYITRAREGGVKMRWGREGSGGWVAHQRILTEGEGKAPSKVSI